MIWLTGNKGMLGSDIEKLLIKTGVEFISSDREIDICSNSDVMNFLGGRKPDWIINAAAYTDVDRAEQEIEKAFNINAEGVKNIAETAGSLNAGLIHISTDYVFDGQNKSGYSEGDPVKPVNAYGESKLKGELYLNDILAKHYIIRTSWLYGAYGKNFVLTILDLLKQKNEIKIVSDQTGSPTYSCDLAEIVLSCITRDQGKYGIYNFSNSGSCSWYEFACEIYRIGQSIGLVTSEVRLVPVTTSEFLRPAMRPAYSLLKKDKIKRELNVNVRGWKEALAAFMEVLRSKTNGETS
ncbi:dTDP-4-dehydrorhamnose reductase [bacterium]|nr:dTDP-4-dehydrorhamnose reductase [Candidatus Omnitrophota bacterium]MBU3929153.1 dTDP-4-dehydrorhamnose reductase [bacterium]MBU4122708.1 dTDP-4-dehydrorhamnose reductase [bacterium]